MRPAWEYLDDSLGARHLPLDAHEDRVVQQAVFRPAREKGRRQFQPRQVLVHRADGGIFPLVGRHTREEGFHEVGHDVVVEDQRHGFGEVVGHGQEGEVKGAEIEDQAGEVEGRFGGEEVEERQHTQMAAGGLEDVHIRPLPVISC